MNWHITEEHLENLANGLSESGYGIIDSFLSSHEVEAILEEMEQYRAGGAFRPAGIGQAGGHQVDKGQRGDLIRWINPETAGEPTRVYLERMKELMLFINRACFLSLKDFELHYTTYPAGTFYKRHLDQFRHNDHRRLSVICYLNFGWTSEDGGQLRIYRATAAGEAIIDVEPLAGRLVCFRSDMLEHEVLPTHRGRQSLTGWLRDQLQGVQF